MYRRHRSCFGQAAKLFDPQIEPVSIPYENGKTLPGYFMRAAATGGPWPTVMILGGGDTTCEELYYWGGAPRRSAVATTPFCGKVPIKSALTPWIQL